MVEIILVCINIFQCYIKSNIEQLLCYDNNKITVITNEKFFKEFEEFPVTLVNADELNTEEFDKKSELDKEYRNGFWNSCSKRLFLIGEYMKNKNIINALHIENDVLLYCNSNDIYNKIPNKEKMYIVIDSETRGIPSIMFIPDYKVLNIMLKNYIWFKNDMENLKLAYSNSSEIDTFPIYTKSINNIQEIVTKNFEEFQCLFDGAAIGQYLGGVDPDNDFNYTKGFVNETCVIDYSCYDFFWVLKPGTDFTHEPYIKIDDKLIKIMNLHIHSKKLHRFMCKHVSEIDFIHFYD